ncbi:MAG: hypothetical protein LKM30_03540 [Bacilli bacterium]|jgi:hypothetical protein|nr:hypothetical protein [Bacilli bacterium]
MNNPKNVPAPSETKNRRLTWKDYAIFVSFALALAAVLSFFASAVRMTISSTNGDVITTYGSAYSFIFGGKVTSEHATYTFKGTNGLLLSGWILILVGLIGTASGMACVFLNKLREEARTGIFLISALCEFVASLLLFSSKTSLASTLCVIIVGSYSESVANTIDSNLSLRFGVWGSGVFALLGALVLIVTLAKSGNLSASWAFAKDHIQKLWKKPAEGK